MGLIKTFNQLGISPENTTGLGSDGCNVMMGFTIRLQVVFANNFLPSL